jgi:hypothetical protein
VAGEAVMAEWRVPAAALRGSLRFDYGALEGEIPFRVLVHGEVPDPSHGVDVTTEGTACCGLDPLVGVDRPASCPPVVRSCCRPRGRARKRGV